MKGIEGLRNAASLCVQPYRKKEQSHIENKIVSSTWTCGIFAVAIRNVRHLSCLSVQQERDGRVPRLWRKSGAREKLTSPRTPGRRRQQGEKLLRVKRARRVYAGPVARLWQRHGHESFAKGETVAVARPREVHMLNLTNVLSVKSTASLRNACYLCFKIL